jgi:hypothetical protein
MRACACGMEIGPRAEQCKSCYQRKWRANNPEKSLAQIRRKNERQRVLKKKWCQRGRAKHNKIAYYGKIYLATPEWVDMQALYAMYDHCPPGMHVDHIVPIQGENVCGLHVPWNLQYLTAQENSRKRNKVILQGEI